MVKNLYSILDKATQAYMNPIHAVNDGEAIRIFTTFVNEDNQQSNISLYPEQFSMWRIGTLDSTTGNLENDQKELITGLAVKNHTKEYTLEEIYKLIDSKK